MLAALATVPHLDDVCTTCRHWNHCCFFTNTTLWWSIRKRTNQKKKTKIQRGVSWFALVRRISNICINLYNLQEFLPTSWNLKTNLWGHQYPTHFTDEDNLDNSCGGELHFLDRSKQDGAESEKSLMTETQETGIWPQKEQEVHYLRNSTISEDQWRNSFNKNTLSWKP